MSAKSRRGAAIEAGLLAAILAAALAVRLAGVARGLPYIHEWDEPSMLSFVVRMLQRGDFNPGVYIYPGVYYYLLLPVVYLHYLYLHAHGILGSLLDIRLSQPLEPYWYMDPTSFYVWGRTLTTLIGTATVAAVYAIGRTVYGPAAGLLAAALLAVAPGAVYFSDTVRVEVPMAFIATLAVLAGLGIVRRGGVRDYALTGALAGLAISTKTNAFMIVPAVMIAHLVNPHRARLVDLRVTVMGLCVLAGAILGTPYVLMVPHAVLGAVRDLSAIWGGVPRLEWMRRSLPEYLIYLVRPNQAGDWTLIPHAGLGWPAVVALLGIAAGFRTNRSLHLYVLSFPALYFVFMSGQRLFPIRTMTAVVPFAALFAAVGCVAAWRWLNDRLPGCRNAAWKKGLAGAGIACVLAVPASNAVDLARTLGHPDTRAAALDWLLGHAAPGARIAFDGDLRWHTPDLYRLPFAVRVAPRGASLDWYRQEGVNLAVVGAEAPMSMLPAVAVFPRPAYLGPEALYPIISPSLRIVRPAVPQPGTSARVIIPAGAMVFEPVAKTGAGRSSQIVRLPDQQFAPGLYVLSFHGHWPSGSPRADLTARVTVGRTVLTTATLNGARPLRFSTPAVSIDRMETLPVTIDMTYRIEHRSRPAAGALYPPSDGCGVGPDVPSLNARQVTLESWVYLQGMTAAKPGAETQAPLVGKRNHEGYFLHLVRDGEGRIFAEFSGGGKFAVARAPFVPLRQWTHIAATYDGHEARLFLNGAPAPLTNDGRHEGIVRADGAPLVIGCRDPGTSAESRLNGRITGVRIYNTAVPIDTIRHDAGLLPEAQAAAGLVGAWSFARDVNGRVLDASGTGNDLIVTSIHPPQTQGVPTDDGPDWTAASLVDSVVIRRVEFPVTVDAGDLAVAAAPSNASRLSRTEDLPDLTFLPGAYALRIDGGWPRAGASPADRLHVAVAVGGRNVGTADLSGTEPLRLTTPPFSVDRTETLPVQVTLIPRIEQRALRPPVTGCAVAQVTARLNPQALTIEAWVYPEQPETARGRRAAGSESEAPIASKGDDQGYYLRLVQDAGDRLYADLSVAGRFSVGRAGRVLPRRWTHVAATYDGRTAQLYLNGFPAAPIRDPHYVGEMQAASAPLIIGCRSPETPNPVLFHGLIAGVRVWDRVLPADVIRSEAGPRPAGEDTAGLIGSWRFQALVHGAVPDLTGGHSDLSARALVAVPDEIGPPVMPEWAAGRPLLGAVTIRRVAYPVTLQVRDLSPGPTASATSTGVTETLQLDQAFTRGVYTLSIVTADLAHPSPAADRVTAEITVGGRLVGTVTAPAGRGLSFTTPPFEVARPATLPVRIAVAARAQHLALHPPDNGCAVARDTAGLNPRRFTVAAWVYPEAMNEPPDMHARGLESENPIVSKRNNHGYYLRLVGNGDGRIFADLSVAGKFSVGRAGFVPLAKWTHIAATYDGREARMYIDGRAVPPERNPVHEGAVDAQGAPLVIGCRDPGTTDQLVFIGFIGRVRVWNQVLTPEAIRNDAGADAVAAPGLAGSWSFDALTNGTVADQSGANNPLAVDSLQPLPVETGLPGVGPTTAIAGEHPNLLQSITIRNVRP